MKIWRERDWMRAGGAALGLGVLCLLAGGAAGQDLGEADLTVEGVTAAMEQAAGREGLTEEVQGQIKGEYELALARLAEAEASREAAGQFMAAVTSSPEAARELNEEAASLVVPEDPASLVTDEERSGPPETVRDLLLREEAELVSLQNAREELLAQAAEAEARSVRIPEEVERVQTELFDAEKELASLGEFAAAEFPLKEARRVRLRATKIFAEARLKELEQERLSAPGDSSLAKARLELHARELERARARVLELRKLVRERVNEVAVAALAAVSEARESGGREQAEEADAVERLAKELQAASHELATVEQSVATFRSRLGGLKSDYQLAVEQIEASEGSGSKAGALAQSLLDQQRALPDPQFVRQKMRETGASVADVRLARLRVDRELSTLAAPGEGALAQARLAVLEQLRDRYAALVQKYGELEVVKREYLLSLEEFSRLFKEKLLWVRSSPAIGPETVREIPAGLEWLFGVGRGAELVKGFSSTVNRKSFVLGGLALVAIVLLFLRPRFRRRMAGYLTEIRGVSSDGYRYTLEAMGFTLLIAVPFSLLMYTLGRQLLFDPGASDWVQGVARGIMMMAPILFGFIFVRELCRPDGVAEAHFRWKKPPLAILRRVLTWIAVLYVPAGFLIVMLFNERSGEHMHSLGRVIFLVSMIWGSYWISVLLHPRKGIPAGELARQPGSWLARLKFIWYPLAVLLPLGLGVLAAAGYFLTALVLNGYLQRSAAIIVGAILLYFLVLRWFSIRERKLALEKRLAERQAKREAAEQSGETIAAGEEGGMIGDEEAIDLVQVGMQTRRLLVAVVVACAIPALWAVWADALPALQSLDMKPVIGAATWADLILAGVVVVATTIVAKNLPGILEIAILQNLPIDHGSRYAAASLAQYVIVAIGGLLVFQILPLDWSQLGWAFAALSVGLGFGLQEIVANFVCGIILLFERPIRVGDVVTVSGVTGTVSKIQMRATTITDWDRKEFVVPNKEFITGQLLNWTLSNTTNRIVINVGVAYGSDIVKVQEILMEVLRAHPDLMEDPGPVVTFGNFGDSSLDFTVRCYLPNLDRRLGVTHELYSEIYRRFEEESIEIPFPQRDLHLRSDASKA